MTEQILIRGINTTTHALQSIENIILNILPKYTYNKNIISFNFTSIRRSTGFKITDIRYEYAFTSLSSSNRDDDFNSEFDKYEANMVRQDEASYLLNKVSCQQTMIDLTNQYGPFDDTEIQYYIERLKSGDSNIINWFQKELIFNLFFKYFGDLNSIQAINVIDYIKLMIIAKRMLQASNMVILPYIISSKVIRTPNKKSITKKEQLQLEASPYWNQIREKYKNEKIEDNIREQIAIILSSEFRIIDFKDDYIDGKMIDCIPEIVIEEFLLFILII